MDVCLPNAVHPGELCSNDICTVSIIIHVYTAVPIAISLHNALYFIVHSTVWNCMIIFYNARYVSTHSPLTLSASTAGSL